jgi:hypothetical protein
MPIWGALATAAGSILGGLIGAKATTDTNAAQAATNEKLYQMQRADALSDWDRNNKYNSPAQQMQRFKEAGLNPNLIYGNMQNAAPVRSVDAKAPDYVAPRFDKNPIGEGIQAYYDLKQQDLTIKNQEKALALADAQTRKVQADTNMTNVQTENLRDQSPWILEEKMQSGRLRGQQVQGLMQSIEQNKSMNPLLQDKLKSEITTMSQTRKWQDLTSKQQIALSKATEKLMEMRIKGQDITNKLQQYQYDLQNNFGINQNTFSDLLKIGLNSLLK